MNALRKIFFFVLFLFLITSLIRNVLDVRRNLEFYNKSRREYETSKQANARLKTQIVKQKSLYEVEKTIRNKLNLAKEGETVVIVPSPSPTPPIVIVPTDPAYQQWLHVFFRN